MTDNQIGDEGAKAVSEMMKANTTLTSLDLSSEEERKWKEKENIQRRMNNRQCYWS